MISQRIAHIRSTLPPAVNLVCVSKFHPSSSILEAYAVGERHFGESRVQELLTKHEALPKDIAWHFIGHLQTNKVRALLPFVYLIHSVDSLRLLQTIEREAALIDRTIAILLEVHIAQEESKTGFTPSQIDDLMTLDWAAQFPHIRLMGIMGMATNTDDETEIRRCFSTLQSLFLRYQSSHDWQILSMGMSDDYPLAISYGSNCVRIGSTIFGERNY